MAKILVVDDSGTVRDEVAGFLRNHGLDVATAVDGKDGLAKLKATPGVRLVISDVNMPNMDGLTMVEKIRGELANTAVNVVMLTTESSPAMKERGKAAGVKGWIVKPFKGDAVLDDVFAFLVRERLVELTHRGSTDLDVTFRLTDAGRVLALEERARSSYSGPAPVTLDAYLACVNAHSVRKLHISQEDVWTAFDGIVIDTSVLDAAAAALNAGRPLLIYGPAGSGKTFLAERLGTLMHGRVPVPHAICAAGEVIQIYDPLVHVDAPSPSGGQSVDRRWRLCRRPVVMSGGELTLAELDLRRDEAAGFYQAPPHMKANMGMYVVDDLGRQRVEPRDLLNRWLRPLDRGVDFMTLESGNRFVLPFDVWPVFSSNLSPEQFCDDAFLRRLGSKLHVGPLSIDEYRTVFDAACASLGLVAASDAFDYLLHRLHLPTGKAFLACFPADLLRLVAAGARYRGDPPEVTHDALYDAWASYFGAAPERDGGHPPPVERGGRTFITG